jgi:hypothetical protein
MSKASNRSLFFYQGDKLITVKRGEQHHAIFRNADMPLAEVQTGEISGGGILATDDKGSVLSVQDAEGLEGHNFSAYGEDPTFPRCEQRPALMAKLTSQFRPVTCWALDCVATLLALDAFVLQTTGAHSEKVA